MYNRKHTHNDSNQALHAQKGVHTPIYGYHHRIIGIVIAIILIMTFTPAANAAGSNQLTDYQNDKTKISTASETYLLTSYNPNNYLEFSISGNSLTVKGKLQLDGLTGVMLKCGEQSHKYATVTNGQEFSVCTTLSHSGALPISIYTQKHEEKLYWSYISKRIYVEKTNKGYRIIPSLVLDQNLAFAQSYVNPDKFRDNSNISNTIKDLSNRIVGEETNDYNKLFLLHKWVVENIYYDYDAYYSDTSTFSDSTSILSNKRSVCNGYATLLQDLIRAQGIPCIKVTTYSLGLSTNGGSFSINADKANMTRSNHAHVEAWVNGRWVIMDPTWDSDNRYENGHYETKIPNGYYYFDVTPETLALDHKYITRANGQLKMQNNTIVGADTPPEHPESSNQVFIDVAADAYYANPVQWAIKQNITCGTGAMTFSPDSTCTTAQILTFLWRAKGSPEPASTASAFTDIQENDYFYKAALWAKENDLVEGITFNGNTPCTRYDTVNYLWKLEGKPKPEKANPFTDISGDTQPVAWAKEQGITAGTSETTFTPSVTCTRGQIVTFLYRAYANN